MPCPMHHYTRGSPRRESSMARAPAPTLEFNDRQHRYSLGKLVLPSVTQVIPDAWPAELSQSARELASIRGLEVHAITAKIDLGASRIGKVSPAAEPYVEAHRLFLAERKPKVLGVEVRSWHKGFLYAGTLDRIYKFASDADLVDLKTAALIEPETGLQTAAYEKISPIPTKRRYTLQLKGDGTYKLHEWKGATDFSVFVSCLNYYRWKQTHRPDKPVSIKEIIDV